MSDRHDGAASSSAPGASGWSTATGRPRSGSSPSRASTSTSPDGEFVTIVGPSGCGKSTFLKIVNGLLPATEGEIQLRSSAKGREDAMVFQDSALFPWYKVVDNVAYGLVCAGVPKKEATGARAAADQARRPGRVREQVPLPAVRRHAAAGEPRPGPDRRPGAPADGRAVRRARRADPRGHAGRAAAHLANQEVGPEDGPVHHPPDRRGRLPVRPGHRDERPAGPDPGRHPDRPAAAARPPRQADARVRARTRSRSGSSSPASCRTSAASQFGGA